MLRELLGTSAPIRALFATRWNPEFFNRQEVGCPTCKRWYRLTHNAHCPYCCICLVERPQQKAA